MCKSESTNNTATPLRYCFTNILCHVAILLIIVSFPSLVSRADESLPQQLKTFFGEKESTKLDTTKPLKDQVRKVEFAGKYYAIPIMYLDAALKPGEHQTDMLLEVTWPDMLSRYDIKDRAEYKRLKLQDHRVGWILLEREIDRPNLASQLANLMISLTDIVPLANTDGLEPLEWYLGTKDEPVLWYKVYLERDPRGSIVSFIICARHSVKYPSCKDKFISEGMIYQLTYNEENFLSEWRQQRKRAIELIQSFESDDNSTSKK